ncbi:MAG: PEP-CTERM sorting domain-containing protein [Planctomycetales bacterium]|nr:PEP-CTERM sorting domain-containing protein [Planctomycetales bacterium]
MKLRTFPMFTLLCLATFVSPIHAAKVLMLGNDPDPTFGDDALVYDHLAVDLGHDVTYLAGGDATTADGEEADLIVISSTLGSGTVRGKFTGVNVPILNWEEAIMDGDTAGGNLAMGAGAENGTANTGTDLRIINPNHPLAAGLSGVVQIATDPIPRPHITGSVAPGVTAVATLPGATDVVLGDSGVGVHLGTTQTGTNPFVGYMDEMAIWERSLTFQVDANNKLTGGEVFDVYNTGVSTHANGLAGYWSFNDVDDADFAADSSGNAYDALITGGAAKNPTEVAPGVGGAGSLEVDGTQMVDAVDAVRVGGELTYSFWFNADSGTYGPEFDTSDPRVDFFYGNGNGGPVRPHLSANRNGRPVGIYLTDGATDIAQPIEATTTAFTSDEWHHVLITWDGAIGSVFVDGELNNQEDFSASTLFAITAVDAGGILTDGTSAPARIVNFPIQDVGFASLTDDGLTLFDAAIAWLLDTTPTLEGDFDGDGVLSEADINLLNIAVAQGGALTFDVSGDGVVDINDINTWVVDLKKTWVGDANLDGEFNSGDFVAIFTTGKFELDVDATWGEGDWNGDLRFNSGDFVAAFQGGGYELGLRPAVAAVPEPSTWLLSVLGLSALAARRRR